MEGARRQMLLLFHMLHLNLKVTMFNKRSIAETNSPAYLVNGEQAISLTTTSIANANTLLQTSRQFQRSLE